MEREHIFIGGTRDGWLDKIEQSLLSCVFQKPSLPPGESAARDREVAGNAEEIYHKRHFASLRGAANEVLYYIFVEASFPKCKWSERLAKFGITARPISSKRALTLQP